jgi:hypothetical protein
VNVHKLSIKGVFDSTERLEAPLFQRPYVWTESPNWEAMWEAVQSVAERRLAGRESHPHFLGTIVLDQLHTGLGKVHARQIIDGQQRLTTLQLALAATRDLCIRLNETRYAKAFERLTVNDVPLSEDEDDVFKVWPTNADRADFRAVMAARSAAAVRKLEHAKRSDGWLIPDAYLYFHDRVDEWLGPAGTDGLTQKLQSLFTAFSEDLHLVVINLEAQDDAQEIFETLNSLGTPLLPADLVKNYLFHRAEREDADTDTLYERFWAPFDEDRGHWRKEIRQGRLKRPRLDLFLGHFITLQQRDDVVIAQLFSAYRELVERGAPETAAAHMERFSTYANVYYSFENFPAGTREAQFFDRLWALDNTTIFPVLLEVLRRHAGEAGRDELLQIFGDIESFFVRRAVCELTSKNYNRLTVDMLKTLHASDDYSAAAIRAFLLSHDTEVARWPSDDEFSKAWMDLPFYKRLRNRTRMILEALELAMHTGKTEKITIDVKLTVEHLLPRDWARHWPLPAQGDGALSDEGPEDRRERLLHTIGNLTLLTKELNPSVSNGPWAKKREKILEHSALTINRPLPERWDEAAIEARTKALLKTALTVWPRPS